MQGELDRLKKYNLFNATFVVLLFWIGIAYFLGEEELGFFVPLVFLVDGTMMAILLVGATLFYEKKEHTMNSVLVSPVTEDEYLAAKIIINIINAMITVLFVSAAVYFLKGMTFNYMLLIPTMVVVTVSHSLIGIWLSYYSLNFSSLLVNYILYVLVFVVPSLLAAVDVIGERAANFLIVLPPEAAMILISAAFGEVETWRIAVAFVYLVVLSVVVYKYLVKPGLNPYAMRETGV